MSWNHLGRSGFALFVLSTPVFASALDTAKSCSFSDPGEFVIEYVSGTPALSLNPDSEPWRGARRQAMIKDCSREFEYKNLRTDIHSFWTDTDLYFLFSCPYEVLNVFLPAANSAARPGLWDRDVVEMFLGDDWQNIRHYREFEIAPTGDWIDLAIDLDRKTNDRIWRSGWQMAARIDQTHKTWYAAARIPLSSITQKPVGAGTRWRMNLYRIDGLGLDPSRHFMCWQPTCVQDRDPNHVPEHFGTLIFEK
jgi:hypothetical protein